MKTTLFRYLPGTITLLLLLSNVVEQSLATHIPRHRLQQHSDRAIGVSKRQDDRVRLNIGTVVSEDTWAGLDNGTASSDDKVDTNSSASPTSAIPNATNTVVPASSGVVSETHDPNASYTPTQIRFHKVHPNPAISSNSYADLTEALPSILANANEITAHSWELGCFTDTLLEVYYPLLTPFEWDAEGCNKDILPWEVLRIAQRSLVAYDWTGSPKSSGRGAELADYLDESTSPVPLTPKALVDGDGSLGDPVALVQAVWVLAKFASRGEVWRKLGTRTADDYAWAVGNQLAYLFNGVRSENGTISQREDHFELWADMGSMITPALSFLSLDTGVTTLLRTAFDQFGLEASGLLDTSVNIYRHISGWDTRFWATGNGWMIYGALRNLASAGAAEFGNIVNSQSEQFKNDLSNLFTALFATLDGQNLVPNYIFESDPALSYGDTAGTALIVAGYYRFISLYPGYATDSLNAQAERAFDGVVAKIDEQGWVTHAVDPMGTNGWVVYPDDLDMHSPEAQAFVAKMWKARTDAGI